ncbi:hypothetical protein CCP3SC1AL1_3080002 [Gammaproteobacteria bacterium]
MKPLITSASDIEAADPEIAGCYRKWWLKKIAKLPEPPKESSTFGDVIHAVCERYLLADENGNRNGVPVELYPEGWERPVNRFTGEPSKESVGLEEQALIKALISKAISEGVLMRVAGRQIEKRISKFPILEGVLLNGFIDLLEPGAIRDHKSTKDMKWAKSAKRNAKESLYNNDQLMVYGYWYYVEGGYDKTKPLTFSHQYFVKSQDNPHVEKREVQVTWAEVEAFHRGRLAPVMEMMLVYRDAAKLEDIPLPRDVAASCRKFGGCPFTRICTEQETVNEYRKRVEAQLAGKDNTNYTQLAEGLPGGEKKMATNPMMEKIKAMQAAKRGESAPETAKEQFKALTAEKQPATEEQKPTAPVSDPSRLVMVSNKPRAPWHHAKCKSCIDNDVLGMNSKGTLPCKICDMFTKKDGGKTSDDYKWKAGEGTLTVTDKETCAVVMSNGVSEPVTAKEVIAPVVEPVKAQELLDAPTPKPVVKAEEPKAEPVKAPVAEQEAPEPSAETVFEDLEVTTEREKFSLLIGCAVIESKVRGGGKLGSPSCRVTAEELLILVETEMSRIMGVPGWAKLNSFERREAVTLYSKPIAELLGASTLTVARLPRASLLEAVVMGIRPYAGQVIQALAE